jgi:RND family efflux transporter MFP subunit
MKFLLQQCFGPPHRTWGLPAAILIALALLGWWSIRHAAAQPAASDEPNDLPMASVARVTREDLFRQVTIPAEFRPYEEVELHAKVSGFVKDVPVDFGDKVKAGQLLATLEVPELRNELTNAIAVEQKAEADHTNAHLILTRLTAVNKDHPDLVAQQDLDTAAANDQSTAAAIAAANADVDKFRTLVGYTTITAPFDGVVTWRYADPGALIQAGTSSDSQSMPLVRVSDNYRLRLDFPVSVQYVQYLHVGDTVDVRVDSMGSRVFTGKITRATGKVDLDTRNMFYEIEVPNADLEIAPGMYATVILKLEDRPNALAIPIQAVAAKSGSVLVVKPNQEIESRPIKLGIETPDKYEVLAGLKEGDEVIVGNPRRFQVGEKVQTMAAAGLPGEP